MDSIAQNSLHDELLDRLRQMIISGQFIPGEKIPERSLCEQFAVSRTPLREALKVLAAEGLVQLAPNRGAVVAILSPAELEECLPITAAIEALTGELACENITDIEIEEIATLHSEMVSKYDSGDMPGFVDANQQIHERILSASRNSLLKGIYETLFFRIGWRRLILSLPREKIAKFLADHERMLLALKARNGEKLSLILRECFDHVMVSSQQPLPEQQRGAVVRESNT